MGDCVWFFLVVGTFIVAVHLWMIRKFYMFGYYCMEDITFKVVRSPHGLTYNLMCYDDFRWYITNQFRRWECYDYEEAIGNNDPLGGNRPWLKWEMRPIHGMSYNMEYFFASVRDKFKI